MFLKVIAPRRDNPYAPETPERFEAWQRRVLALVDRWTPGPRGRRWFWGSLVAVFAVICGDVVFGTPRMSEIRAMAVTPQASVVYDVHNQPVFSVFKERRTDVALSEISPNMIQAVLAIEDRRFYQHGGLDLWRIGGAALANVKAKGRVQGGSTITQQLARKSFLSDAKSLRRKLKEAYLAVRLERRFTKDQILEMYLNKIYFGDGYYGIAAASRGYFAKSPKDLTVDEAALLAGLIQAPSAYAPTSHMQRALARRTVVLRQMVEAEYIDEPTAAKLDRMPVKLKNGFSHEHTGQYFKNQVTRELVERFGWQTASQAGLKVYATLDGRMQQAAEAALTKGLDRIEKMPSFRHKRRSPGATSEDGVTEYLQGALVAMDPVTGEVRAMIGGRDFDESQFNRALQAERQAGSAFKPFVYAAALETGYTPATVLTDLDDPVLTPQGNWIPEDGHSSASAMTMRAALKTSSNRAAVRVLRSVGIPTAVSYADRLGLDAPSVPSMVLGAGDVTLMSMTAAYGAFANGGWLREPVFIRRVEDANGNVIYSAAGSSRRAVSEHTAFLMATMLADVINGGTGYRARQAGFYAPAAGKTGTTNDYKDAWFVGFTPTLVTGVWVGFDQPTKIMANGYAGELAAPIWGAFMKDASPKDGRWIARPEGIVAVEVCRVSGALPTEGCHRVVSVDDEGLQTEKSMVGVEYFRRGTEPTTECPVHGYGWTDRLRGILGISRTPAPPSDTDVRPAATSAPAAAAKPAATAPAVASTPVIATAPEQPAAKKKGFWGRLKSVFAGPDKPKPSPSTRPGGGGN